jgi:hypothetical protein
MWKYISSFTFRYEGRIFIAEQTAAEIRTENMIAMSVSSLYIRKQKVDSRSLSAQKNKYTRVKLLIIAQKAEISCFTSDAKIITAFIVTGWGLRAPREYLACYLKSPHCIAPAATSIIKIAFPKIHSIILIFLAQLLKGHVRGRPEFKARAPNYVNMFTVKRIFIKIKKNCTLTEM